VGGISGNLVEIATWQRAWVSMFYMLFLHFFFFFFQLVKDPVFASRPNLREPVQNLSC
jgi:hypothetical protein